MARKPTRVDPPKKKDDRTIRIDPDDVKGRTPFPKKVETPIERAERREHKGLPKRKRWEKEVDEGG